jgi:hypothetical protein
MMTVIDGLPADVLGIATSGKVTHSDYRDVLIPGAEAMMAKGPIKMMYVVGADVTGFALEAMWDDGMFGARHWREFSRVAVVTDHAWLRGAVSLFARSSRVRCGSSRSATCPRQQRGSLGHEKTRARARGAVNQPPTVVRLMLVDVTWSATISRL